MLLTKKLKVKFKKKDSEKLELQSGLCRQLYNAALQERIDAYKRTGNGISVYDQKRELPGLKEACPEFKSVYNKYLSCALFRLDSAYKSFFRRCKGDSEKKGFPRYRGKNYFFTLDCPAMYVKVNGKKIHLPQGITASAHETIPEKFRDIHISKSVDGWFITFAYEIKEVDVNGDGILAIDLGLANLVTGISSKTCNVIQIKHRKPSRKELRRLDLLRSKRDKCKKYSRRWNYLTKRLRKELNEWTNKSIDHLHKVSHHITTQAERIIVIGKLEVQKMVSDNKNLNRLVQNEWRIFKFVAMLRYKSIRFGKVLFEENEAYTTQDCFHCGKREKKNLSQRTHKCDCGFKIDRDANSALNILRNFLLGHSQDETSCADFNLIRNLIVNTYVHP